ncbi:MAG: TonB-dependent receptor domain-containing protein [Gemmatimonadaceae bacterium]
MKSPRWIVNAAMMLSLALLVPATLPSRLAAQGVTTGAISGTVTDAAGKPVENAQVQITNRNTGFRSGSLTRANGYYYVQGLEVGGPYTVNVRRIGYEPAERNGVTVSLSSTTRIDLQLAQSAVTLSAVTVSGQAQASTFSPAHQGVSTEVTDSLIRRLPTLNRNLTDLVKLTPQVLIPTSGGPSAGGQYNRYNNFTIDGANQNDRFNLNSSGGLPGGAGNGRIISQEAVKEFRVLMSPSDVRQANFTGMLVNAVTKSGTNEWHGGAIYNFRNQDLSSVNPFRATTLDVKQYGFQLGGPIIRDRLQFYVAPEWQQRTAAAAGPYVGQPAGSPTPLNISPDSIALIQQIVSSNPRFGFNPGAAGFVPVDNPLTNLFGRLDFEINQTHRLVLRQLINRTESFAFSRGTQAFQSNPANQNTGFRLTSNSFNGVNTNNSTVAQLYSNFSQGTSNEFIAGFNQIRDKRVVPQITPEIGVGVVPVGATGTAATTPSAAVTFGTEQFSINNRADQDILELQDNVSIPWRAHTFTVGGRYEHLKVYNNFAQALGGAWVFPSIQALQNLQPNGYRLGYPNSGNVADIPASFNTNMTSFYGQDQWAVTPNLTITGGLRADVPTFTDKPPENTTIENLFAARGVNINTSWVPKTQVLWSPRIGFNWDVTGDQKNQVRGTVGVFTAPPPYILVANGYQNTGLGLVTLLCTGVQTPAFTTDVSNLPRSCAGQQAPAPGAAGTAGINLTDPNFKYPQSLVASLGTDRQLPWGVVGTFEALYRKAINGVFIRDLNTLGPRIVNGQVYTDRNGRVLYADTITAAGAAQYFGTNTSGQKAVTSYNNVSFSEGAIYVTNQSKDYNYTLTGQLHKQFSAGLDATFAYTYNRAYDVQSLTSDRAISNWRNGREYAGLESEPTLTTSAFERRHRILAYGTYTLPWWKKWSATDVTLYYEGTSGFPIDYVAQSGDLNGDGFNGNDLIYVPKNATDPNEIKIGSQNAQGVFTQDAAAAAAFDKFISNNQCLNEQRGTIMKRNSCRTPWQNRMDLSLRQSLPQIRGQAFTVQLDVVNFANALGEVLQHVDGREREWGKIYVPTISNAFPQQAVLQQTARTPGPLNQSMPVFNFNTNARNRGAFSNITNLGYQMALTFRYEF